MTQLIFKLPFEIRKAWVKRSLEIENERGMLAEFRDLVEFVNIISDESSSLFGKRIFGTTSKTLKPTSFHGVINYSTNNSSSSVKKTLTCLFCKETGHKIWNCFKFRKASLKDRWDFVNQNRLCFKCLGVDHFVKDCRTNISCAVDNCRNSIKHNTLLHRAELKRPVKKNSTASQTVESCSTEKVCSLSNNALNEQNVYLCIVPVKITRGRKIVKTYAFLDQGSTNSFCDQRLVNSLNLEGDSTQMSIQTLNGSKNIKVKNVSLTVCGLKENNEFEIDVCTISDIPVSPNVIPLKTQLEEWPHLKGIKFDTITKASVTLLIGANYPELFAQRECRVGARGQPMAIKTPLGWSLLGPSLSLSSNKCNVNFVKSDSILHEQFNTMWDHEFGDGTSILNIPNSREDRYVYNNMKNSVRQVDGHYQLPLPWRPNSVYKGDSKPMALKRLANLKNRLLRDNVLRNEYVHVMQSYIDEGHARKVPESEIETSNITWTLPHFPVTQQKKGKVRIVFDCAAKFKGSSLNDMLMQGPDLVNNLLGVLLRFRQEPIALCADIKSMFHQVKVTSSDAHALRFYWWPGGDLSKEPVLHQMMVHLFGLTSSPSCAAFCLRQTAVDFGSEFELEITDIIRKNFYVDDCLHSVSSVSKAKIVIDQLTKLLSRGGFHLHKWITNNSDVLNSIEISERSKSLQKHFRLDDNMQERALGNVWNICSDTFTYEINMKEKPNTRRGVLSVVSSLYDPLGFVAPVTLEPKLIFQNACKLKLAWDELLPPDLCSAWKLWLKNLSCLKKLQVPRCLKPVQFDKIKTCELHLFCDASSKAYSACSYIRLTNEEGNVHCCFLIGKCRLAPIKSITIPKLELTAAVLAVRLDALIRKELQLPYSSSIFWSDSAAVIKTIYNSKRRFSVFVANRIAIIESLSDKCNWRYVPSKLNPADLGSRGCSPAVMLNSDSWLYGPEYLRLNKSFWPQPLKEASLVPNEFFVGKDRVANSYLVDSLVKCSDPLARLIEYYSDLYKLKKAAAWMLRVKSFLKNKAASSDAKFSNLPLSVDEINHAELVLVSYVQRMHFSDIFEILETKKSFSTLPHSMQKLTPVMHEGLIRIGGRLERAAVSFEIKHPIILPGKSHLTDLIIRHHHDLVGHSGAGHTWSSLRQKYWILKGGASVRRVIGKCVPCKKRNSATASQFMSDLPPCRLQFDHPPFTHVGVDYFGPLFIKHGRSTEKRYGCLFTCLTVRAVHIEITHDLTSNSFLSAFRRFAARRGMPEVLYSDNGTNLVGAHRILRESLRSWNQQQIHNSLRQQGVRWRFNPPAASHMGGSWERMIRSVRRIMSVLLTDQSVSEEVLTTTMTEIEWTINSRPLLPITMDEKNNEPLTPNHLLHLKGNPNLPPGLFDQKDCYVRRRWAQAQFLADQFWRRWVREYLPYLIHRQKWYQEKRNVKIDDIVLVVDETRPRSRWALGRVVQTFPDAGGFVRSVQVKTSGTTMKRPITKLCPIMNCDMD